MSDRAEMMRLTTKALKMMAGSPAQKEVIKQLNVYRKKLGMDPLKEDAPANATGTAVAGTGDDSSTVIVKKKKPKQDKLMRRMGITETINRVIPDLEYTEDCIMGYDVFKYNGVYLTTEDLYV